MESVLDPNSPLQIVIGFDRPEYLEMKAIELITEAQRITMSDDYTQYKDELKKNLVNDYHDKIKQAISLLSIARIQRGAPEHGTT